MRAAAVISIFSLLAIAGPVCAGDAYTTRIEPRPYYGAVITLEEGVRVIRPLPPERHVIINPNNTPLALGFNETRVYENRQIFDHRTQAAPQVTGRRAVFGGVAPRYWGYNRGGGRFYGRGGSRFH